MPLSVSLFGSACGPGSDVRISLRITVSTNVNISVPTVSKPHLFVRSEGAVKSGIAFSLTMADLPPVPDCCPALGVPFQCGDGRPIPESLTLDRINPALGYVPGNVMWLSHRANAMKRDATLEQLQRFAHWALKLR